MSTDSIFFDLETTDLSPVGQILNCCFTVVDGDFKIKESLQRKIRISRLQLPRIGALLANRTVIEKHQESSDGTEAEIMREIYLFLSAQTKNERIPMIGFNSSRFDVEYLRTSLIRNGFNPYFKVINRDLLHVCRYLTCFDRKFREGISIDSEGKLSLTLDSVARRAGLLKGSQEHESSADVELTIELAKYLKDLFAVDVRTFEAYGGSKFHGRRGSIVRRIQPNYDAPKEPKISHCALLDNNHRYALWIDLERYIEAKDKKDDIKNCISFLKVEGGEFFIDNEEPISPAWREISSAALKELEKISLTNFFAQTTCDIEAFIYRIPPDEIDALHKVIWKGSKQKLKLDDAKRIYGRFRLANLKSESDYVLKNLPDYAEYRYGGGMLISRSDSEDVTKRVFHPTLKELLKELGEAKKSASSKEDMKIISSLERFYLSSEVYKCAGERLLSDHDKAA